MGYIVGKEGRAAWRSNQEFATKGIDCDVKFCSTKTTLYLPQRWVRNTRCGITRAGDEMARTALYGIHRPGDGTSGSRLSFSLLVHEHPSSVRLTKTSKRAKAKTAQFCTQGQLRIRLTAQSAVRRRQLLRIRRRRAVWIIRGAVRTRCCERVMKRREDSRFTKRRADAEPVEVRPQELADPRERDAHVLACQFTEQVAD